MTAKILELKQILKQTSTEIHDTKATRKQDKRPQNVPLWAIESKILVLKCFFRTRHIAYCLMRGRTYEQIEPKTAENNKPNMDDVKSIMESYKEIPNNEENVLAVAA